MLKNMKPGNRYLIVNIDEPYAKDIYEILKQGQQVKEEWPEGDISFEEWVEETFGSEEFWQCDWCGLMVPTSELDCPCAFEDNDE